MKSPEVSRIVYDNTGDYLLLPEYKVTQREEVPLAILEQFRTFSKEYNPNLFDLVKRNFVDQNKTVIQARATDLSFEILTREGNDQYCFTAIYNSDKSINLDVELLKKTNGHYSRSLYLPRFPELLNGTIAYFEGIGNQVHHVDAKWFAPGDGFPISTNYEKFQAALKNGVDVSEAVFMTATGRTCRELGFTTVTDFGINEIRGQEIINVRFSKI